jgi:hypothetical protein
MAVHAYVIMFVTSSLIMGRKGGLHTTDKQRALRGIAVYAVPKEINKLFDDLHYCSLPIEYIDRNLRDEWLPSPYSYNENTGEKHYMHVHAVYRDGFLRYRSCFGKNGVEVQFGTFRDQRVAALVSSYATKTRKNLSDTWNDLGLHE